jgi:hypothetical protein
MTRSFAVLTIAAALVACGPGGESKSGASGGAEPIKIGHVASLTGDTATFGQSTERGMRMAFEEINEKAARSAGRSTWSPRTTGRSPRRRAPRRRSCSSAIKWWRCSARSRRRARSQLRPKRSGRGSR